MDQPAVRGLPDGFGSSIFFGTIAGDVQSSFFNLLYVILLGLVVGLSMSSSFTEEWGEYFALLFWATVGMMLLTASEELVTLFLTLETMTICLYLSTALEKTRRRSAEAGLKYFVYGSVSSALFLFGLEPGLRDDGHDAVRRDPRSSCKAPAVDGPGGQRGRGDGDPAYCWWASASRSPRCRFTSGRPMPTKERLRR